jgi:hypothetical protein
LDILARSKDFAAALSTRLRERIYKDVIPYLAEGIARELQIDEPDSEDLTHLYQLAMTLLYRLLFIAYAEDQDLLPYRTNDLYRNRSLKETARGLLTQPRFGDDTGLWEDIWSLFTAVDIGRPDWGIPPYDGGLFSNERDNGKPTLEDISLPSTIFGPALTFLLVDESPEGRGPVDFRSLGVREFGTIYEGLLESEFSVAETDLTTDEDGHYLPARENDTVIVSAGSIYLHNASGKRKSTGSYYTKSFAVDHLLDTALEPALDEHISRLDALGEIRAGSSFFDFRVADIAMGSGHFLVAAIDRIEARLSAYLTEHRLPEIEAELSRLREAAQDAMQSVAVEVQIDDNQLLRRQIARHCIFGVDINPIAVELAKLSVWIHTFVPGLPLSLLDYNLITGNSLIGIASLDEAKQLIGAQNNPLQDSMFLPYVDELLGPAQESLRQFSQITDATIKEIEEAKQAFTKAKQALQATKALFDISAASRIDDTIKKELDEGIATIWSREKRDLLDLQSYKRAQGILTPIQPIHFPLSFPQVFLRSKQGFDVILGNPPWEKLHVERHEFWARYSPGLRSISQRAREERINELEHNRRDLVEAFLRESKSVESQREIIKSGDFPGLGSGHPDLYKAFTWRFWNLINEKGKLGVVLPRAAMASKGGKAFRKNILLKGRILDFTILLNNQQWVFEDVHPQYSIGLLSIEKKEVSSSVLLPLRGPYQSHEAFKKGINSEPIKVSVEEVLGWSETHALPLLPTELSYEVFIQLRKFPNLSLDAPKEWKVRPLQGDLNTTNDRDLLTLIDNPGKGFWSVYAGESFDLWNPDTGSYYAAINSAQAIQHLREKRFRSHNNRNSVFYEFSEDWINDENTLFCLHPRLAFRDVTNRTNTRTVITCLIPEKSILVHTAPFFVWPRGDEKDTAFLLGVLSSIPLDWYARRFVESHLSFYILNSFPIPRPNRGNSLWERVVQLAGRLACSDERFHNWADTIGVDCGSLDLETKNAMIYELDAVVAHLYKLSENQLVHIFETFHEGWDFRERLQPTLVYFRHWEEQL